jgi:hypothetical protein
MEDPIDKSQKIAPVAFEDITTPEEHAVEVRRIFTTCGLFAGSILLVALVVVWIALARGTPLQTIAFIVPIVMGVGIATFAIAYAIPVGLVSLKRLEMAYRMGYFGLRQSGEATTAIKEVADQIRRDKKPLPVGRRPVTEV